MIDGMDRPFPAIASLKAGDESAWSAAFSCLWPVALHIAKTSPGKLTLSDAEEIACDAVRLAIREIAHVESERELRALVAVIARRRAIMLFRKNSAGKRIHGNGVLTSFDTGWDEATADLMHSSDPAVFLMEAETLLLLEDAMKKLDPVTRQLVHDKYVVGDSYEEISATHKIPVGTLCPKIMRALKQIRARLQASPTLLKELGQILRRYSGEKGDEWDGRSIA